ncbi:toll/interleukin-1 receptor domain-containing protein [Thermomonospora curvata]|uniref:TIR domain-containing protein n=1 Tax=Thermomonospora curvata (strain ATCC 19995 / DSM 43183 / JCM 3096 / KCTC 9072 / NBRC 15933 / NCIMB 10081 / Henssen B9) TaxID=471852 RepID=D1A5Y5_THECD|nr:toll/interleukin-1 receptor domain-containing protein [Thermomonospora curvata]ACY98280.1 hypothetical protein Tcur_2730 [Thermomonospora curvata DSM 43183]
MHEVFINYRTGDGDEAAALLEQALSHRFGDDRIFRAGKSIPPGEDYTRWLRQAVRRCSVLIAVIGPEWARDPRLRKADDWVRRELLEARECGIPVLPVLKGRGAARLDRAELPRELRWLADMQSLRLDVRDNKGDLARIGDTLTKLVPALREADRNAPAAPEAGTTRNSVGQVHQGPVVQTRDFNGVVGHDLKGGHGAFHLGTGDQNNISFRDGGTYVAGDLRGNLGHSFGQSQDREEER